MKTKRRRSANGKDAMQIAAEFEALKYIVPGAKIMVLQDEPVEQISAMGIVAARADDVKIPLKGTIIGIGQGVEKDPKGYDVEGIQKLMRVNFTKYGGQATTIALMDGDTVDVITVHASDLYLMWLDSKGK